MYHFKIDQADSTLHDNPKILQPTCQKNVKAQSKERNWQSEKQTKRKIDSQSHSAALPKS